MRILSIKIFFSIFFLAIFLRLSYWQVVQASWLQAQADEQHLKDVKIDAVRGSIFASDGSILVSSNPTYSLYGLPKSLASDKKNKVAYSLAKIITGQNSGQEMEELARDFLNKLSQDLYWVQLKKNIDVETKKEIERGEIPGIGFDESSSRFYPEGSSAAHVLGFVGSDAKGGAVGYFGLEGFYEGELKGLSGSSTNETDALGLPILTGFFSTNQAKDGKSLVLNIDRSVQYIAEEALKSGIEKYGAKSGSVTIMDPKTGGILALASYPNYDPAAFSDYPREFYKNSVVADQYEPGSTFKVLVMASAINEGLVTPDTKCDICSGPVELGGFSIRTWDNKYFPDSTMIDVIIHSDNTGMVFVSKKLGLDRFYSYFQNFGFGQTTDIDLQDESSPEIRPKDDWKEIDLATASFGQGIAVTPIQMVRAVAVIANGGFLMEPHLVHYIKDDKSSFEIKPKVIRQVLKSSTAESVKEMMVAAVEKGEAKFFALKGFKVAGKTGTAQIPVAGHYDPNKTIASFVGFAPADDPKFVMLVRYDQPSASIFGAETAAPTFFDIAKQLFAYYKIPPSE